MRKLHLGIFPLVALISGLGALRASAQTSTVYVDGTIGSASCSAYNPATRSCSGGSATAYRALSGAASAAGPGTLVLVRGGTYAEQLNPANSGTAAAPIVFRRYAAETPTISNLSSVAILLQGRRYVEIDGFTVTDVVGWARLEDASYNTIRNTTFRRATSTGTTGSVKLVRSTYNRILNSTLDSGNDNLVLVDAADRNLVEGNTFTTGGHSLLSVRCSNYNVFRKNTFANPNQKAIEIYDCEGVGSDSPVRYDSTKHNVFDGNTVTQTRASSKDNDYNSMQHGAQHTVVRRNVFRNALGGGVNYQWYTDESVYVYGNRMYNNTFYANRCYAIVGDSGTHYADQRVKNNILYKNTDCAGGGAQTRIPDTSVVILTNNAIETTAPGFVDEAAYDLRLAPGSRMIDAGASLTATASAGSGTTMTVQDASYFYDGFGIPGESGDVIQIGPGQTAQVVAVNYAANTLTLSQALTWSAGQGVSLQYGGNAPDMGAFESGATGTTAPRPPTNVRIIK